MKKNDTEKSRDRIPDTGPLLEYLHDTVERDLAKIRREAAAIEREAEEALARRIEAFRREEEQKAGEILAREEERLARTFQLEVRRIVSRAIEELFEETIALAAKGAGRGGALAGKIITLINDAASPGDEVTVMVAPGDESLKKTIAGKGGVKVKIVEDQSIRYGGAILKTGTGPLLNLTIDRILFRKKEALRLEMMSLLRERGVLAELEEMYGSE